VKIAVKKAVSIVLTISVMVCVTLASYLSINWLNVSAKEVVSVLATINPGTSVADDELPGPDAPSAPDGISTLGVKNVGSINQGGSVSMSVVDRNLQNYTMLFIFVRAEKMSAQSNIRLEVMDNVTWSGTPVPFDVTPVDSKWSMLTLDLTGTKLQEFMNGTKNRIVPLILDKNSLMLNIS